MPSLKPNGKRLNGKGSGWISKTMRLAIYLRDSFTCAYCGRDMHGCNRREISLDHLKPQCEGGTHEARNLITACVKCNSHRRHTPWRQYATGGAIARIERLRYRKPNVDMASAIIRGEVSHTTWNVEAR